MKRKRFAFLKETTRIIALGGFLFGYDTGVINGVLSFMSRNDQLALSASAQGLVSSSLVLGCTFGALSTSRLADRIGRKQLLQYIAVIFTLATVACALSANVTMMIGGRFILGLSVGCASSLSPLYLNEISPNRLKARDVNKNAVAIILGQLSAFCVNALLGTIAADWHPVWRIMIAAAAIPALALWLLSFSLPQSPFWLLMKKREAEAQKVFDELAFPKLDVQTATTEAKKERKTSDFFDWKKIFKNKYLTYLLIAGITVGFIQQASGINTVMYYGTIILQKVGMKSGASLYGNIFIGLVSSLAILLGSRLIERRPHHTLLVAGLLSNALSLGLLTWVMRSSTVNNLLVLVILAYFLAVQQGIVSPVTWLLLSELFPQHLKAVFNSIGTTAVWLSNFVISLLFPILMEHLGIAAVFLLFAVTNFVCVLLAELLVNPRLIQKAGEKA